MDQHKLKVKDDAARQKRHWVRLTNACNQKCIFCHDRQRHRGESLLFADVVKDLKSGRERGCFRVVLSGGEPTLHPGLVRIIKKAKALGYRHVQLVSNGRMFFYEDFVQELKQAGLDEVTLSLHSHLEKSFEKISGVKGSYHQAMKGLFHVLKHNFIVSVDIVINKINYQTLDETLKFFMALGVSEFDLLHLIPFGDAWKHREEMYYSLADAKSYLDKAFELSRKEHVYVWTNRLPAMCLEGYEELIQNPCKMADEIRGMERDLRVFIETGGRLSCFGDRCPYCFMQGFCQDLAELRERKTLFARTPALCLKRKAPAEKRRYTFRKNMDLYKFLEFFIEHRYFVKSFRCVDCKVDRQCGGAQIDEVRTQGFKILKPL